MLSIANPKKVMKREVFAVRKDHECYYCGANIPKKSEAVNIDTRFDGKLYAVYLHPECEEPAKAYENSRVRPALKAEGEIEIFPPKQEPGEIKAYS